jgi:hypothetical protein
VSEQAAQLLLGARRVGVCGEQLPEGVLVGFVGEVQGEQDGQGGAAVA